MNVNGVTKGIVRSDGAHAVIATPQPGSHPEERFHDAFHSGHVHALTARELSQLLCSADAWITELARGAQPGTRQTWVLGDRDRRYRSGFPLVSAAGRGHEGV